jgi:hypothetical protein
MAPNIEVIESALPNTHRGARPMRIHHPAGEANFQCLHDNRGITFQRFSDHEVKVLGHHDIRHDFEFITLSNLLKNLKEKVAPSWSVQQRLTAVATTSNEM